MGKRRSHDASARRSNEGDRSISATEAQNNFGRVLSQTARGAVYITKHDRPTAVVLSIDRYNALAGSGAADLDELAQEFDTMLARMQTTAAAAGVDALFDMGPAALGEAAVRGARPNAD